MIMQLIGESRPNNMNLNLNSLRAFFSKCFSRSLPMNLFLSLLLAHSTQVFLYPRKKMYQRQEEKEINNTKKLEFDFLRADLKKWKKHFACALDIQKTSCDSFFFRCIKLKFHDEVRWVNYSSFRLINKPKHIRERCWKFNIPIGSMRYVFSHSSLDFWLLSTSLWYEFMLFSNFLYRDQLFK